LQRVSSGSLSSRLPGYRHVAALTSFVRLTEEVLCPVAIIMFGSLTKGTYYLHSDADICAVLAEREVFWAEGYDRTAALDPEGVVQPMVYGRVQFLNMIRDANSLALEVCHDGWMLGGEEDYVQLLEEAFKQAEWRYGLQKTESGWLMRGRGEIAGDEQQEM